MNLVVMLLVLAAIVCFLLAAWGAWYPRTHVGWLGMALLSIAFLLAGTLGVNLQ